MDYEVLKNHNIDVDAAVARFAGKSDLFDKYILLFKTTKEFTDLTESVKAGDIKKIEYDVHSLKGLAGNLGINSVYNASCLMLDEIRKGNIEKGIKLYQYVKEEFELACQAIDLANK